MKRVEDRSGGRVNCSHFARGRAPRSAPLSKSARSIGNRSQIGTNCNSRSILVKFRPFFDESFPGVERKISRWDRFQSEKSSRPDLFRENARQRFSAQNRNDKLSIAVYRVCFSFSYHGRLFLSISIFNDDEFFAVVKV